ncbi:hypothetical protein OPV22_009380 [Ensete ventricosum]|uniref:Uncharacterized protein n=1 Tax=Ensete ventricosum TaxID=4639 RepID=A0AAV8RFT8_ENSVE|nr:hypothetical protein OPV22_009380 [Ensete ventricosum]
MVETMRLPSGTTAICVEMDVMDSGSFRYQKNWFKKESSRQDAVPRTHIRNVSTGVVGSSSTGGVGVHAHFVERFVCIDLRFCSPYR